MSIGKFKKDELRSIADELKLVVPDNAKVLDLRELIQESEIYKNDKETLPSHQTTPIHSPSNLSDRPGFGSLISSSNKLRFASRIHANQYWFNPPSFQLTRDSAEMTCCAAYGCNDSEKKDNCRNKTCFQFPLKNPNLLKTWIAKIRREKFVPSYASVLRSDHFEEECFEYQNFTNRRHLKLGSVPTNFVFTKSPSFRRILERCMPSTSTEICEPPVSNEEMGIEEIQSFI
ncbi:THAP domain-containing protein 3 [Trichonephila clavipes]|nr:THAP domain-containing protein 3 [Trichonephila clavipes]